MFKKIFQKLKPLSFSHPVRRFCSSGSGLPNDASSSLNDPLFNPTLIINKHLKSIKLMQFNASRIRYNPEKKVKIVGKRLDDLGFLRQFGEFAKAIEVYSIKDTPEIEGANTPSASWVGINFPIKDDPYVRNMFKKFYTDGIRTGKLIEILDLIGGACAYRYMKLDILSRDATFVTICVDDFQLFEDTISSQKDLFISSYVCYAGKSALEIRVDVTYTDTPDTLLASAYYVFVARDAQDYSKAKTVPRLVFDGEYDINSCILRAELGKKNQQGRKEHQARSTFKMAPSSEESQELHNLFKMTLNEEYQKEYVPIPNTAVEKTLLMHLQDKNIHGKIFGGYLMKEASDLAWTTAYLHGSGRDHPQFVHIDEVAFLNPVEIGSVSMFKAWITYVEENLAHVMITVDTLKSKSIKHRTCELHMTLAHSMNVPKVVPLSYFDGMAYIEGKRRISQLRTL